MQKLKEANLYQSELIPISGKLVERYNTCLAKMGFAKTKLKKFSIDGLGWSPEIAGEKDDLHYLNNGEANPHGIIVSPLQKGVPVYVPTHSFDRELMKQVFKEHGDAINDITRDSAICIDFDQKIDVFYEAMDILKYKEVVVSFRLMNDLETAKKEQLALVSAFKKDTNFIDEKVHEQLLASAKKYGDLRTRKVTLKEIRFPVESFYTKAFGGVYLLRNTVLPMLVFESEVSYKEVKKNKISDVLMYHILQPELMEKLQSYSIVECDLEATLTQKRYHRIKKYVFSEHLAKTSHPVKEVLEDSILFKSYLNKIDIKARKKVMGVELYLEKKKTNSLLKVEDFIESNIFYALHTPHSSLLPNDQDLIWKLLVNVSPKDILFLYWYDKEEFYKQFKTWDESLKDWVIETICNNI